MNISNFPNSVSGFDPTALHDTLKDVQKTGTESLTKALTLLSTVDATGVTQGKDGVMELAPPKATLSAMDLTLRIGLLQDALNQLQQAVSKNEIQGRLNDLNRDNKEQLDKMKDQMKHMEEEAAKRREAAKKTNIFQAIANFFKAIFDIISAVFTAIAAIGYALTGNVVAAAGLFTASAALLASGVINFTLAIDSVVKAAGGSGFSEDTIAKMQKASEILGYVAMAAAMIGGLGAVVDGVRQAASMAAGELVKLGVETSAKDVMKQVIQVGGELLQDVAENGIEKVGEKVAQEAGKEAMKEAVKQATKEGASQLIKEVAKDTIKAAIKESLFNSLKPLLEMTMRQTILSGVVQGSSQIIQGVGTMLVADIKEDAAAAKKKADEAEAQAKAIEAMIQMLHKLIEKLQDDLQHMIESSMDTVSAIFNAADETAASMKDLMHFQPA